MLFERLGGGGGFPRRSVKPFKRRTEFPLLSRYRPVGDDLRELLALRQNRLLIDFLHNLPFLEVPARLDWQPLGCIVNASTGVQPPAPVPPSNDWTVPAIDRSSHGALEHGALTFLPARLCGRWNEARLVKNHDGGMAERFKAPVLKTGVGASSPWVRIPLPPPQF